MKVTEWWVGGVLEGADSLTTPRKVFHLGTVWEPASFEEAHQQRKGLLWEGKHTKRMCLQAGWSFHSTSTTSSVMCECFRQQHGLHKPQLLGQMRHGELNQ